MPSLTVPSPIGALIVTERGGAIVALGWGGAPNGSRRSGAAADPSGGTPLLRDAAAQLAAYFAGRLTAFDLPLAPAGSDFQQRVWAAMQAIPYGETATYGALAARIGEATRAARGADPLPDGRPGGAARAVGAACGANPIPIVIPCHRVVAANGRGGYSGQGGLATKDALLALESRKTRLL